MKNLIFCLLLLSCSTFNKKNGDIKKGIHQDYPEIINSNSLKLQYNTAKWLIYVNHCDRRCYFNNFLNILDSPYLGTLELKFEKLSKIGDTIEFKFYFYYKDTLRCDVNSLVNYGEIDSGVAFKGDESDEVIYHTTDGTVAWIAVDKNSLMSRYANPLQPDVLKFIRENKEKLHPWFLEEAVNRQIID